MKTSSQILSEVESIFATKWESRDGRKVPDTEDLKLGNDAVKLSGTVLYADMEDSTGLVGGYRDWFATEMYKCYLKSASYIIRNNNGAITAFDGDRVMAVFVGDSKNSNSAKCALQISWIVGQINMKVKKQYPNTAYQLRHAIGIDTSSLFVARTGIRNNNDLVWVGRAANYAAKLCALVSGAHAIHMTDTVFNGLDDKSKFGGKPRRCMWEKDYWESMSMTVYKSNWTWGF